MRDIKILIVEDEGIEALALQHILVSMGYNVVDMVYTGEEAIAKTEQLHPDIVLMDIMLQGKFNGTRAAEQIHKRFDIPVIYTTAYSDESTIQRAKLAEPYGYLVKPLREREVQSSIEMAIYKHKMERKLKDSEEWLGTVLRNIGEAVITTDKEGLLTFMNPIAENLSGKMQKDFINKKLTDILNIIDRETRLPIENPVTRIVNEGIVWSSNLILIKNENEIFIDSNASPIKDYKGNIIGVVLVFRDVTERILAEEKIRVFSERLKKSNEELEQFAYVASHDLQEPLRTISSYIELIFDQYKTQLEPAQELVDYVTDATKRMQEMIDDILQLSRVYSSGKPFQRTDINKVIDNTIKNLRKLIDKSHTKIFIDEMPFVNADSIQMEQLFQNLIDNAIKFSKPGIIPEILIHAEKQIEGELSQWIFSVKDNGIGIDPKDFKKLFIIFHRLHSREKYKGTGIGLALCKKIIERHGGKIWVESTPDIGSTFYFSIPEINNNLT